MIKLIKALFHDSISWMMILSLAATIVLGLTALVNRYERVNQSRQQLIHLDYDIQMLQQDIDQKRVWLSRLQSDPNTWEQVAREKMNYLDPVEVLVTFVPEKRSR